MQTSESFAELENRFSYHAPDAAKVGQHESVRGACRSLAHQLDAILPNGRHKSLAMTALEEVMHWANAAVACQTDDTTR